MLNMHVDPNQHKDKYISVPDCCRSSKFFIEKIAHQNIMCTLVCGPNLSPNKKKTIIFHMKKKKMIQEKRKTRKRRE